MSAVEMVIKHEWHRITVASSECDATVWLSWRTGSASVHDFLPASKARELAAALIAAADASEKTQEVPA